LRDSGVGERTVSAICTSLGLAVDKVADYSNTISRWGNDDEGVTNAFSRQALSMAWDFAEASPITDITRGFRWAIDYIVSFYSREDKLLLPGKVISEK
jgi:putative DNA methylase